MESERIGEIVGDISDQIIDQLHGDDLVYRTSLTPREFGDVVRMLENGGLLHKEAVELAQDIIMRLARSLRRHYAECHGMGPN